MATVVLLSEGVDGGSVCMASPTSSVGAPTG